MTRKSAACAGLRIKNAPTAASNMRLKRFIALSLHSVFAICDAALRRQNRMRRGERLASRRALFPADKYLESPRRHAHGPKHADRLGRVEAVPRLSSSAAAQSRSAK